MVTLATPPSTIDGLKRSAKSIKRVSGITHHQALDEAARKAGFQNFMHAKRAIAKARAQSFTAYVTVYWNDLHSSARSSGRCTVEVQLKLPLSELLADGIKIGGAYLSRFKLEAPDHLELRTDAASQNSAMQYLDQASFTLLFLNATGLVGGCRKENFEAVKSLGRIPKSDHMTGWEDPQTGDWLLLDEPYISPVPGFREEWLQEHGLYQVAPSWHGLYYPGYSVPYLISPSQALIKKVQTLVEGIPDSAYPKGLPRKMEYDSKFISPARIASGKPRRPHTLPSSGVRNGAVAYGGARGVRSKWRPVRGMPLEMHTTVGPILHKLCNSSVRAAGVTARVYEKLNQVRSRLEDWAFMEHPNGITEEVEAKFYYGPVIDGFTTPQDTLKAIETVWAVLLKGYEDCKPRAQMLAKIESAAVDLRKKVSP
ncbi:MULTISPECIES: DUF5623 domain-containing protein [unclassified Pseudomonas]|uniref:DUF5623 domain-containing protein n=1 Tax=unclassified Pseudomonas TaxID=196821 RepID=UPI0024495FE5|nr:MULTISPECIES: DUF5623 domain-containing protein [unclassified Pseudomonas]MDG9929037.1 DUF5623 domain-containing protein [Pseudomonas sp. GD04042]MDH0483750.1 DUF5623 domain-containing protein [Pseudomonas sp. GD04015]MDH0604951.1 DUF5623 domain-containing protein [Pseudomonas sp. GD03869]